MLILRFISHIEPCGVEQHSCHGLWAGLLWSRRRQCIRLYGSILLLWRIEWLVRLLTLVRTLVIFFFQGSVFTSSRLVYAAGRERYLPAIFGRLHSTRQTPLNAALLQSAITIAFIMIGDGFRSLINFSVVASWGFYFFTVE